MYYDKNNSIYKIQNWMYWYWMIFNNKICKNKNSGYGKFYIEHQIVLKSKTYLYSFIHWII